MQMAMMVGGASRPPTKKKPQMCKEKPWLSDKLSDGLGGLGGV